MKQTKQKKTHRNSISDKFINNFPQSGEQVVTELDMQQSWRRAAGKEVAQHDQPDQQDLVPCAM